MPDRPEILFISDLHLDRQHPQVIDNFIDFMKTRASKARVLYLLGDLFEVWLGDDDPAPAFQPVFDALKTFSAHGKLYFMHGNRDFLIGPGLAETLNGSILQDPTIIQLGDNQVALMHGDLLCTDDVDYQNFRQLVRNPQWQHDFLAKPLQERHSIAAGLREKSHLAMQEKQHEIMDVNLSTVEQTMRDLDVDVLIHGHTHRPAMHHLEGNKKRYVLGDWNPGPSYLSWSNDQFKLIDSRVNRSH